MTTLLSDIKDQVLQRTGTEYSGAATDPEWIAMINSSLAELYEILISKKDLGYYETEYQFAIAAGNTQPYPADFKEVLAVDYKMGSTYYPVHRYVNKERARFDYSTSGFSSDRRYRLVQAGFKFLPAENATGTYRVSYIPRYLNKLALTDSIGDLDLDNWHEYVIVDCAIKFLTKQETDCQVFIMQKLGLLERINKSAGQRDANEPYRLTPSCADAGYYNDTPRRF